MKEIKKEKKFIGNSEYIPIFYMLGTKKEHLELYNKVEFLYKGYECYVEGLKQLNYYSLDEIEGFKIIGIKKAKLIK